MKKVKRIMKDNKIIVTVNNNKATLKYDRCKVETKAYIGKNGTTTKKKEGDDCTPIGEFSLGTMLGTHENVLNEKYKYSKIDSNMYWIDDSKSKYYNQLVDILKVEKDWNSAEHLIEFPVQYEYLIEIKTNPNNIPDKGSAIFLHCSNDGATHGCIAINREDMFNLVNNIDENTKIEIINI